MSNHRLKHSKKRSSPKPRKLKGLQSPTPYTIKGLNLWFAPRPAFRFFDLPQEIQDLIYRFYFSDSEYVLEAVCSKCAEDGFEMHKCVYNAKISGRVPGLQHEEACRKMAMDSRLIRDMICPRSLIFIEKVEIKGLIYQFSTYPKYAWLRQRIKAISCRGITKYAINQDIPWNLLALECPNLSDINIQVRVRHEYVYWADHYARHALQEDPDDANRRSLNLPNLHLAASILQQRSNSNSHIKIQSSHWWPLSTKAHKNCFTKIMNYEVYPDSLKMVNRVFELANMETAKELLKSQNFIRHYNIR